MTELGDYSTNDFKLLDKNLTPAQAINELSGTTYGVITDGEHPLSLLLIEDLERNHSISSLRDLLPQLPPTVIVGRKVEIKTLAYSKVRSLLRKKTGARGAIVLGDQGIVGVLPVQVLVTCEKESLQHQELGVHAHDGVLGGDYQTPAGSVFCTYPGCNGHLVLVDSDPDRPPDCPNPNSLPPHKLQLP